MGGLLYLSDQAESLSQQGWVVNGLRHVKKIIGVATWLRTPAWREVREICEVPEVKKPTEPGGWDPLITFLVSPLLAGKTGNNIFRVEPTAPLAFGGPFGEKARTFVAYPACAECPIAECPLCIFNERGRDQMRTLQEIGRLKLPDLIEKAFLLR